MFSASERRNGPDTALNHNEAKKNKDESHVLSEVFSNSTFLGGFTREMAHRLRVVLESVHLVNHSTSVEEQRAAISLSNSTQSSRNVSYADILNCTNCVVVLNPVTGDTILLNHIWTQAEPANLSSLVLQIATSYVRNLLYV